MSDPLLQVENIEVTYQRSIIGVADISLSVREGSITAILGTNGAGKSTTLRAISGFIALDAARVSKGIISLSGDRIESLQPHEIARRGVAVVPEREKIFPNLTVDENILVGQLKSNSVFKQRTALVYDMFPRLGSLRDRQAGLLSGGERQMLAIASALACMPRLLLIDELSLGLAPVVVEDLAHRIIEIRKELSLSILLVEQNASVALGLSDYAYLFENGRVILQGSSEELENNPDIQAIYLGQKQQAGNEAGHPVARVASGGAR